MIKYISKRFIISVLIILLFLTMIILKNYITNPMLTRAYSEIDSTFNGYSIQFDKDKYYDINILNSEYGSKYSGNSNTSCGVTWSYNKNNNTYTFNGTLTASNCWYINIDEIIEPNNTSNNIRWYLNYYYINGSVTSTNGNVTLIRPFLLKDGGFNGSTNMNVNFDNYQSNNTISINMNNYNNVNIALLSPIFTGNSGVTFNNLQFKLLVTNTKKTNETINANTPYSVPFKFGYQVNFETTITNNNSNNINYNYGIYYILSGTSYTQEQLGKYTNTCSVNSNSNNTCTHNNVFYIPFIISDEGYISSSYDIWSSITNPYDSITLNNTMLTNKITLIPIFQGTSKINDSNNVIYLKKEYLFNSLYYDGFNITSNSNEENYVELNEVQTNNSYDNVFSININNKIYNIISNFTNNVTLSNNFKTDNYFNNSNNTLYNFTIINNSNAYNNRMTFFSINFSNINVLVKGENSSYSPSINSNNTYERYNTCSAWYDFNCQLSNATTYIIYNLPLISPLIQLVKGMVDVMRNIVIMITWYEGLGILFSLFIFILMIRVIIMLLKGSNDDRGNKK